MRLRICSDATAAIGICKRLGLGRVRHLAVADLWIQDRLRTHDFELLKLPGRQNPADLLTKYLDRSSHDKHINDLGLVFESGRADSAAQIGEQVVACVLSCFHVDADVDPEDAH